MDRKQLFLVLNFANIIICGSMALIDPFFPTYAHEQGLSKPLIGVIIGLHPLGGIFGSIKVGKLLSDSNRNQMLTVAMMIQAFCLGLFILTHVIQYYWFITIVALTSRLINGIAYSVFVTSFYSFIPQLFPNETEQKIALAEAASSLGYMLGPMVGSILFAIGGFNFPFFTFGISSIFCSLYINKSRIKIENNENEIQMLEIENMNDNVILDQELNYNDVIWHYDIFINALMCVMVTTSYTVNFPLMAQYFHDYFQISESQVGFYMGLQPMTYMITTLVMGTVINPHKPTYMLGFQLVLGIGLFFFGPDTLFTGFDRNLTLCCLSLLITGVAQAIPYYYQINFSLIYSLPQINESMIDLFPQKQNKCMNLASAIFSASISLGEFSGPFIGGILGNYLELDRIASITGFICLGLCISYIPFYWKHKGVFIDRMFKILQ